MNSRPAFSELFFSKTKCFLEIFLPRQEQRSPETVKAYRISLAVFYSYVTDVKKINPMKFRFTDCTYELVLDYSQHLQEEKKMSNSSVNQRLAALKSYLRYAADGDIALVQVWLGVQKVPLLRLQKLQRPILGKNDLKIMLDTPEDSKCGNRDRAILILLFDSAARASELLGITLGDVLLNAEYPSIMVHGKGKKERSIIMNPSTANHLRYYMRHYHQPDEPMDTTIVLYDYPWEKGKDVRKEHRANRKKVCWDCQKRASGDARKHLSAYVPAFQGFRNVSGRRASGDDICHTWPQQLRNNEDLRYPLS